MDLMSIVWIFVITLAAYIIGSFPTGYLLVKLTKGTDIREVGSGGIGATNVKRVLGKKGFFLVMFLDAMKGFLPVLLAQYLEVKFNLYPSLHILPVLVAFALVIGHSKSIFLGFVGGKSVATGGGAILAMNYPAALIGLVIWSVICYTSKYISLGSIAGMFLIPFLMYFAKAPLSYVIFCAITAIYVIFLHRENIKRLFNGTENKVRQ
ncbi:MAG: glycerol-3-phosphate 1-O-acyltransferase PlsY [Candidatus Gastranaerophilales bacterium]|nr:glycerol-3-phosphate 1-O-acyltransferase PlsY [Candidatus Gastranaerophilales bacterium]